MKAAGAGVLSAAAAARCSITGSRPSTSTAFRWSSACLRASLSVSAGYDPSAIQRGGLPLTRYTNDHVLLPLGKTLSASPRILVSKKVVLFAIRTPATHRSCIAFRGTGRSNLG